MNNLQVVFLRSLNSPRRNCREAEVICPIKRQLQIDLMVSILICGGMTAMNFSSINRYWKLGNYRPRYRRGFICHGNTKLVQFFFWLFCIIYNIIIKLIQSWISSFYTALNDNVVAHIITFESTLPKLRKMLSKALHVKQIWPRKSWQLLLII